MSTNGEEDENAMLVEDMNEGKSFVVPFNDKPSEMTYGRRLARFLSSCGCYFKQKEGGPSLDQAWAFFEHYSLPRHFPQTLEKNIRVSIGGRPNLLKAEAGETEPTVLYSVWGTPERELGDFGISVGVYFWLQRVLCGVMFLAGLMSMPNILYFASDEYGQNAGEIGWRTIGSAICTDKEWVPCPTCEEADWTGIFGGASRFATTDDGLVFVFRNYCTIRLREGIVALATMVFVAIAVIFVNYNAGQRAVDLDENEQTTSDYALEVFNPPKDAYDPDEWKEFFEQYGKVDSVTVVLNNEKLVKVLVARRKLAQDIRLMLESGKKFDQTDLESMIEHCKEKKQEKARKLLEKIHELEEKAKELAENKMDVSEVFIIFDTEQGQRTAISELSFPYLKRLSIPADKKYQGTALIVGEAREPNAIRWNDLETTFFGNAVRLVISYILVVICLIFATAVVFVAGIYSAGFAAIAISGMNTIIPYAFRYITDGIEAHTSEGAKEASLYIKVTIFKWINTAIITSYITPFVFTTDQADDKLLTKVSAIFFSELLIVPIIQYLDVWGNFQRHVLGPKAPDQEVMDTKFGGAMLLISLRYCELTKILFLAFYYSAIFPMGFFWAAASLGINYWVDKFCMLRKYGPSPTVGGQVSYLNRFLFLPLLVFFYAFLTVSNYARWPFDNTCGTEETVPSEYVGTHTFIYDEQKWTVMVADNDESVKYCNQDVEPLKVAGLNENNVPEFQDFSRFPPLQRFVDEPFTWMTVEQEQVTSYLAWAFIGLSAYVILFIGYAFFKATVLKLFCSPNKDSSEATNTSFGELSDKFGYIPQVKVGGFRFPFLACEVNAPEEYLAFQDNNAEYPYHKHNLMYDIEWEHQEKEHLFSVINTY
mmetsp:Transcript_29490/g.44646  ORF Transcript_29490/g.44646 Transcript_29490/m.44646 type:complete len:879 (+) Transcript_29490:123-2759(+)|eukprot:CAMPEP_0178926678 /NCGR_PEP_ID=MMETSP0786-20121207/18687_1 /TAXON_ID=186022 /ORGANISM="Thalassionema frauenfeldii, Strain CCMP 1798" /LENGTH=878 /DNA_ID=CAMNT_0020601869 /DNA_START=53 /DNA_END=2689 /DNA_ORIENTATION=-